MKKIVLILILICLYGLGHSQEVYFYTGKNFTSYDFKNSSGSSNSNIKSGTGNFYEIGFNKALKKDIFSYSFGVSLNEYNNNGGNSTNNYKWENQYLGIQSSFSFSFLKQNNFDLLSKFGLNGSSIINGLQQINGIYYDLTKENEFKGLVVTPSIGLQVKYNINNLNYISLAYNYSKTYNLSNSTNQSIEFNTNQIQFGVHFKINSKNKINQVNQFSELENKLINLVQVDSIPTKPLETNKLIIDSNKFDISTNTKERNNNKNLENEINSIDSIEVKEKLPIENNEEINDSTFNDKDIFNFSSKGFNILLVNEELMEKAINYLTNNPNKTLVINGFSSSDGLSSENYTLSLKRAIVAKEYFIIKGIPENRIKVIGKNSSNPKFSNDTLEGRLRNKRVEIEIK
jgi:outer membrane protein OmpA-like peptidoglycan-associated protein